MAATELNSVNSLINDANLKAYYRFESGALTTDTSGEGHTLTAISDPAEDASGQFGGAVALDGNDAYSATDHADFKPTGNFTIGVWFKSSTKATNQNLFQSQSRNTNRAGITMLLDTNGYVYLQSGRNTGTVLGTDYQSINNTTDMCDGAWHFAVGTWDGSKLHLHIDGTEFGTGVNWTNAPGYAASNYVCIGVYLPDGVNYASYLTGSLDDVFLFNGTALSADQIESIYDGTINSASPSVSPSASPSVSLSASPSVSTSLSPSASPSVSVSVSPSASPSLSLSTSPSASPSLSPSASPSISTSLSPSASPSISVSISPSVSPSPSPGWQNYTKGDYAVLPTDDADLENAYTAGDILNVATKDNEYAEQTATSQYAIHQFKDYVGIEPSCLMEWEGQTNCSPTLSTVYLQIYNQVLAEWETVDSNSTASANTDFSLMANIDDLTNYKNASSVISCRVYQLDL